MELIWDDGGRADSGYVGLAGDCVTRAIAIATGTSYRDVYGALGAIADMTPRNGLATSVAAQHLHTLGWERHEGDGMSLASAVLPTGAVIVHLAAPKHRRAGHFCSVIDHVIYDTWNPSDDDNFVVAAYWTRPVVAGESTMPIASRRSKQSAQQTLTQREFDKVLHRLRSLDSTATNAASTEGEKRNALRMMQNLLLRHNLSRDDIVEDDNVDNMRFTNMACPVNGRRACGWEKCLAAYVVDEIFPLTSWYFGTRGPRTLFWFYGPLDDVNNCIALFRELLLTITASAQLQYGGYARGSGASYAEGYVRGLPRYHSADDAEIQISESTLIHARTLAVQQAARDWLKLECDVSIVRKGGSGRSQHDPDAAHRGKQHGSKHDLRGASGRKRLGHSSTPS
ncbi:DUF2786 domain-containing protein [Allorhodopirellula heiligendammensis]|uniref:DUF2786 domain-containing protein n=1 Tax=Allorhodopirellula heiligendammensis TaxID=2714739 RepID=A0A5C6BWU4_9BACT|nr:DUF2786 domain-containing protein [Allorhodopirellula heiligendammensis]TWU16760.1 hypothetical protein Poly21_39660 [Allorhodopirellula heiligendammensis]